jgi:hypothetical protein
MSFCLPFVLVASSPSHRASTLSPANLLIVWGELACRFPVAPTQTPRCSSSRPTGRTTLARRAIRHSSSPRNASCRTTTARRTSSSSICRSTALVRSHLTPARCGISTDLSWLTPIRIYRLGSTEYQVRRQDDLFVCPCGATFSNSHTFSIRHLPRCCPRSLKPSELPSSWKVIEAGDPTMTSVTRRGQSSPVKLDAVRSTARSGDPARQLPKNSAVHEASPSRPGVSRSSFDRPRRPPRRYSPFSRPSQSPPPPSPLSASAALPAEQTHRPLEPQSPSAPLAFDSTPPGPVAQASSSAPLQCSARAGPSNDVRASQTSEPSSLSLAAPVAALSNRLEDDLVDPSLKAVDLALDAARPSSPYRIGALATASSSVVAEGRSATMPAGAASLSSGPLAFPINDQSEVQWPDAMLLEPIDPNLEDLWPSSVVHAANVPASIDATTVVPSSQVAAALSPLDSAPAPCISEPIGYAGSEDSDCYMFDPPSSTVGSLERAAAVPTHQPTQLACPHLQSSRQPSSAPCRPEQPAKTSIEDLLDLVLGVVENPATRPAFLSTLPSRSTSPPLIAVIDIDVQASKKRKRGATLRYFRRLQESESADRKISHPTVLALPSNSQTLPNRPSRPRYRSSCARMTTSASHPPGQGSSAVLARYRRCHANALRCRTTSASAPSRRQRTRRPPRSSFAARTAAARTAAKSLARGRRLRSIRKQSIKENRLVRHGLASDALTSSLKAKQRRLLIGKPVYVRTGVRQVVSRI